MPAPCGRSHQPLTAAQIASWGERRELKVIICATDMNARRAIGFRIPHNISRDIKTGIGCDPYLLQISRSQEMVMTSSRKWHWRSALAVAVTSAAASLSANAALASQGPGGGPGTAGPVTQLVMAIIVYGSSALVIGAGLIGAARRR
jgi:hypothetical protein